MFKKIFVVEDKELDIKRLRSNLVLASDEDVIDVINDIDKAYQTITRRIKPGNDYAAIIDTYWGTNEPKGIMLAKNLRQIFPSMKLIAYTSTNRVVDKDFPNIHENFDALIDKETASPDASAITLSQIDREFLKKLKNGYDFFRRSTTKNLQIKTVAEAERNYFFKISSEKRVNAQLIMADFYKFSLKEDDLQLIRFRNLQDALDRALRIDELSGVQVVVLPTGDGVAIGLITDEVKPVALMVSFGLLSHLRDFGLAKELRVGVHFGRVYHLVGEKGEAQIIGPGINKAARVEAASEAGRVLVSEEYFSAFIDRAGEDYCLELVKGEQNTFKIKDEIFHARFISRGDIGA